MLSLVIAMLVVFVAVASRCNLAVTKYVSLFPVIILTGMVERFWLLESDDGTAASFRTLANTVLIAIFVALVTGISFISATMVRFPEMLGVVVALQMLIGRYTGYRLTELWRFREFSAPLIAPPQEEVPGLFSVHPRTSILSEAPEAMIGWLFGARRLHAARHTGHEPPQCGLRPRARFAGGHRSGRRQTPRASTLRIDRRADAGRARSRRGALRTSDAASITSKTSRIS